MKTRIFVLFALSLMLGSCMENDPDVGEMENASYNYEKFKQTDILKVVVPAGKAAVVKLYEDTLYILDKSEDVMVPYVPAVAGRADNDPIVVTYTDIENVTNNLKYTVWSDMFETIAFEDSKDGDYDYNDVVLHVRLSRNLAINKEEGICIQPVALGSSKPIGLGVYLKETGTNKMWEVILSNDIRADLFEGQQGFINTTNETGNAFKKWYKFKVYDEIFTKNILKANWFIIVDSNKKMFAVSDDFYANSVDKKGRPYGLVFTNIHGGYYQEPEKRTYGTEDFWYPREQRNINTVYPDFDKLFDTSSSVTFTDVFGNPNMDNCVKVMQLYNNGTIDNCYNNKDPRNLYFVRPNLSNYYYEDVKLPVISKKVVD